MNDGREFYGFTWPGKHESMLEAGRPVDKVLRPCVEESMNFDTTENLYIEGDNLEALKVIQKSYMRRVKMIYIDPPYNTGHDFIYNDSFTQTEEEAREQFGLYDDEEEIRNFTLSNYRENTRANPRYHSDWCSMMYPRLKVAQSLLTDDGVIFISIDDNEVTNLRMICNEIFGERNFIGSILWNSTKSVTNTALISVSHTYNLVYCKNIDYFITHRTEFRLPESGEGFSNPDNDPRGEWKADPFQVGGWRPNQQYEITNPNTGQVYTPNPGCSWKNDYTHFQELLRDNRIVFGATGEGGPMRKRFKYEAEERGRVAKTWWDDIDTTTNATQELRKLFDDKILFPNPKPVDLIMRFLQLATKDDSIVLDFFSGSATTAHAVMSLNAHDLGRRKFIMIQLPEACPPDSEAHKAGYTTICDIGRERIKRAGNGLIGDTGFRTLRLDSTNYRDVFISPDGLTPDLLDSLTDNLKPDRSPLDLLFGLVAEFGLPLSLPYHTENVNGFTVHVYGESEIAACFDEGLTEEVITHIAKLEPSRVVFRDSGFTDSRSLINLEQLLKYYAPESDITIL